MEWQEQLVSWLAAVLVPERALDLDHMGRPRRDSTHWGTRLDPTIEHTDHIPDR